MDRDVLDKTLENTLSALTSANSQAGKGDLDAAVYDLTRANSYMLITILEIIAEAYVSPSGS